MKVYLISLFFADTNDASHKCDSCADILLSKHDQRGGADDTTGRCETL